MSVVYKSNKAKIGDGLRITRVSDGGQKLEVLTDAKAGKFVGLPKDNGTLADMQQVPVAFPAGIGALLTPVMVGIGAA